MVIFENVKRSIANSIWLDCENNSIVEIAIARIPFTFAKYNGRIKRSSISSHWNNWKAKCLKYAHTNFRPPTLYLHNLRLSSKPDLIILLKIDFYFCNHFVSVIYVGFQNDDLDRPSHWSFKSLTLIGCVGLTNQHQTDSDIFCSFSLCIFRMEEIFLKIALAESDGAFESVLGKYLPQVIESLETNQQKALEIITHVKKRVTSRPEWGSIMTSPYRDYLVLLN